MSILMIFVVLVILFILYNLSTAVYFMAKKQSKEGFTAERQEKIKCGKPPTGTRKDKFMKEKVPLGWDGDCLPIPGKFGQQVKLCGGEISPSKVGEGHTAADCRKRWLVDSAGNVCCKSKMSYVEQHGKCPTGSTHNLGPGGTQHLLGPGGEEQSGHGTSKHHHHQHGHGQKVPDNTKNNKYKKFIPDDLDQLPLRKEVYEQIGRDFMKDEAKSRGITTPPMHDSEAEVIGKMVWRVYAAEIEQKRANSPKANDEVLSREIQLLNKVSTLVKTETGHHRGKKHQTIAKQATSVPQCGSKLHSPHRTTNMFGYTPPNKNDIKREEGKAFEGHPLHGSPRYFDITNAVEHCMQDRSCGGVNFDSTTGMYTLMPIHARLVKRPHYTALVKKKHNRPTNPNQNKHHRRRHHRSQQQSEQSDETNPYLPVTGIGFSGSQSGCCSTHPRNPNLKPRPYNSLMDLFR